MPHTCTTFPVALGAVDVTAPGVVDRNSVAPGVSPESWVLRPSK